MRYFSLAFVFIFLLFAYWQFNDPDPIWWVALYLIPAYISFRAFQHKFNTELLIVISFFYLANALNTWQQIKRYEGFFTRGGGLAMKTMNQELAREASGLGICIFTFLAYLIYFLMIKRPKKSASLLVAP